MFFSFSSCLFKELKIESETIELSREEESLAPEDVGGVTPTDQARYHFYLFKHTHEGDYMESVGKCIIRGKKFDGIKQGNNWFSLATQE